MTRQTYDVRGRTVLITGAARGIGAETARRLHGKGANVVLCGLEPEELEARATELGDRAAWFEADVTDLDAMQDVAQKAVERFGGIDVVVANAGVAPHGTVASVDPAAFDRTIEVNLLGVWRTVRATLPHVTARKGHFVLIASASALAHTPLMAAYTASKAGVEAFGDALRAELAPSGTTVSVVYFSFLDTDMVRRGLDKPSAQRMRDHQGRTFRIAPLKEGIDAIERGIETRARHIYAPREVRPMYWLRSALQPLLELRLRRDKELVEILRMAEAEDPSELTTAQPTATPR